jgi:hypothetical protein
MKPYGESVKTSSEAYQKVLFYCPRVVAMDGMSISLQIHNRNYCTSDKGYREYSLVWEEVEFGFPENLNAESEALIAPFGECQKEGDIALTSDVGRIPISVMEEVFNIHGEINWEATTNGVTKLSKPSQF